MHKNSDHVLCPYCLSEIPTQALACRHCGRWVHATKSPPDFDARHGMPSQSIAPWRRHVARLSVWCFFVIPIVLLLNTPDDIMATINYASFLEDFRKIAVISIGVIVALLGWVRNIWLAFIIGALEPILILFTELIRNKGNIELMPVRWAHWPTEALQFGLACAASCFVVVMIISLYKRKWEWRGILNPEPMFKLLDPAENPVARFEQRIVKLIGLISGLWFILRQLMPNG